MTPAELKAMTTEAWDAEARKQAEQAARDEEYRRQCKASITTKIPDQIAKFEEALATAAKGGKTVCKYRVPYTIDYHADHWSIIRDALVAYCTENELSHHVIPHSVNEWEFYGDGDTRETGRSHTEYDINVRWE